MRICRPLPMAHSRLPITAPTGGYTFIALPLRPRFALVQVTPLAVLGSLPSSVAVSSFELMTLEQSRSICPSWACHSTHERPMRCSSSRPQPRGTRTTPRPNTTSSLAVWTRPAACGEVRTGLLDSVVLHHHSHGAMRRSLTFINTQLRGTKAVTLVVARGWSCFTRCERTRLTSRPSDPSQARSRTEPHCCSREGLTVRCTYAHARTVFVRSHDESHAHTTRVGSQCWLLPDGPQGAIVVHAGSLKRPNSESRVMALDVVTVSPGLTGTPPPLPLGHC
jgi:hypothetical protein